MGLFSSKISNIRTALHGIKSVSYFALWVFRNIFHSKHIAPIRAR